MISFKRTKKRNYQHPGDKYMLYALAGVFVLMLALLIFSYSGRHRLQVQAANTRELLASSIQNDMNLALKSFDTIGRNSADLQNDVLPRMQRHMYAAKTMNRVLSDVYGKDYSLIDDGLYANFQSIMQEFARRLDAGQSTDEAQAQLNTCMNNLQIALGQRFNAEGQLLPQTASSRP